MKKVFLLFLSMMVLTGCGNRDMFDTNHTYNKAIINLQNGETIEVDVKQWRDYDGEQIQVITEDGTVYLTSTYNCTLIKD